MAVAIAPGGKIVAAGTFTNGAFVQEVALARYNKDGRLDRTFGAGGEVLTDFGGDTTPTAAGVAVDSNGRIVVAATVSGVDGSKNFFQDFALAHYNSNGTRDASFGSGGETLTSFGAKISATAAGVALQPDGKVVVAGSITDPTTSNHDFGLARYNADGKLDTNFGTGGEVTTSFGPGTSAAAAGVAIGRNGEILVAGTTTDNNFESMFTLAGYVGTKGKRRV